MFGGQRNVRLQVCIATAPAFARAVTQRYIGAQKTRSKCRRYSTVRTQYILTGCFLLYPKTNSDQKKTRPELFD